MSTAKDLTAKDLTSAPRRLDTTDGEHYTIIGLVMASIIVTVVMTILVVWIAQCSFIAAYTIPIAFMIGGLLFTFSKASLTIQMQTDYRFTIILLLFVLLGGWLITDSKVRLQKWGAIVLGFTFVIDIAYLLYYRYSLKKGIDALAFWANITADVILAATLFWALTQTN